MCCIGPCLNNWIVIWFNNGKNQLAAINVLPLLAAINLLPQLPAINELPHLAIAFIISAFCSYCGKTIEAFQLLSALLPIVKHSVVEITVLYFLAGDWIHAVKYIK